jgi:hypothetical protein
VLFGQTFKGRPIFECVYHSCSDSPITFGQMKLWDLYGLFYLFILFFDSLRIFKD